MCNPAFIGVGISAFSSIYSGVQKAQQYNAQASASDLEATRTEQTGAYNSRRLAAQNDQRLADMRAQFLGSGIAVTGSADTLIESSARQASMDEQAIKYDAGIQADNKRFEARLARDNAGSAMFGGFLGAAGSIAGGVAQNMNLNSQRTMLSNPYLAFGQ